MHCVVASSLFLSAFFCVVLLQGCGRKRDKTATTQTGGKVEIRHNQTTALKWEEMFGTGVNCKDLPTDTFREHDCGSFVSINLNPKSKRYGLCAPCYKSPKEGCVEFLCKARSQDQCTEEVKLGFNCIWNPDENVCEEKPSHYDKYFSKFVEQTKTAGGPENLEKEGLTDLAQEMKGRKVCQKAIIDASRLRSDWMQHKGDLNNPDVKQVCEKARPLQTKLRNLGCLWPCSAAATSTPITMIDFMTFACAEPSKNMDANESSNASLMQVDKIPVDSLKQGGQVGDMLSAAMVANGTAAKVHMGNGSATGNKSGLMHIVSNPTHFVPWRGKRAAQQGVLA